MVNNNFIEELMIEINSAHSNGRSGVFRINDKVDDETALFAESYLKKNLPSHYRIEFRKCFTCTGWDILIYF